MPDLPSAAENDAGARSKQFGQYSVLREIGRGGMATVFEAIHGPLGKRVALKVMHVDVREKPNAAARFFREARAAAQIRHGHIVNVFDVGTESGTPFIVMDLVDGPDLAGWLTTNEKVSVRELADLFLPICSAVWSAHRAGIIHRDLKPSNVLVCDFPRGTLHPVVVDFGISKILDESEAEPLTQSEAVVGTPHYMAPEQIRGSKYVTERTDQYALGVMLYECATGRKPFDGSNGYELMHAISTAPLTKPSQIESTLPRELETIILRAMHREPSKRFPSVHALGCALLSFAGREGWSRWGIEFTGTGLVGASRPAAGSSSTLADATVSHSDTPADERHPSTQERRKSKAWMAGAMALGGAIAIAMAAPRSHKSEAALEDAPRATLAAPVALPDPAAHERSPTVPEPAFDASGEIATSAVPAAPGSAVSLTSRVPVRRRTVSTSSTVARSAPVTDKPAPSSEPRPARERGENGALILE